MRVLASAETVAARAAGDEERRQVAAARVAGIYPADYTTSWPARRLLPPQA